MNPIKLGIKSPFDTEVERVLKLMESLSPQTEEYEAAVKNLKVLCDARGVKTTRALSTDTIVAVAANLIGLLLVLNYEQMHVITSKSFGLIFRKS
jgi:hypothetical protein